MSKENRVVLEEFFETGDRPTQGQFAKLIRSTVVQKEDQVWIDDTNKNVGLGTNNPDERLHVAGNVKVEGSIIGNELSSAFAIYNLPDFLGPYLELYGKNTPGRGGEMTFVAAEGASQGFNFLQYENDNGTHRWWPRLRIAKDGNVGIGVSNPLTKLHVDGNVRIEGNLHANRGNDNFWIGNLNGSVIELHGNNKTDGREGEIAFIAGNATKGGFRFIQHQGPGQWSHLVSITKKGKVGIGTQNPGNMLEIQSGGTDTGLMLPNGASAGKVLIAKDSLGNAEWQNPTVLNDGDWIFNGNHLHNGNSANVGIGTTNPQEKLHLSGNLKISGSDIKGDNSSGAFFISNHGPYLQLNSNNIGGKMALIAGEGAEGGFSFFQKDNSSGQMQWIENLRLSKDGTLVLKNNDIRFRAENDSNHGLGWHGSGKLFGGQNVDGPVLFGNLGGGLGSSTAGAQKLALRWDNNHGVSFQGSIKVKGLPLCGKTNFEVPPVLHEKIFGPGDLPSWETFYSPAHYYGFISSFQWDWNQSKWADGANNNVKGNFTVGIEAVNGDTAWKIKAAQPNDDNNNTTKWIHAFFIRKEAF